MAFGRWESYNDSPYGAYSKIASDFRNHRGAACMRDVLYCPGCQRRLQLPDEAYGKAVQCPSCQRVFTAEPKLTNLPASAGTAKTAGIPEPNKPAPARSYDEVGDLDRPRSRRRGRDDDGPPRPRRPVAHR